MIPKSGRRFSEKIMLKQQAKAKYRTNLKSFRFSEPTRAVSSRVRVVCRQNGNQLRSADADINMPVADSDRNRGEAHRRIARMAAGGEIEFIAMPRANNVTLLAEPQAGTFLVRRDHFLDVVEDLALTDRPAGVRANVLIGKHLTASAKDADLELVDSEDSVIAIGDVSQFANFHFLHPNLRLKFSPRRSRFGSLLLDPRRSMKPDRHVEHVEIRGANHAARGHDRFGCGHRTGRKRRHIVSAPFHLGGIDFDRGGQHLLQGLVRNGIRRAALERLARARAEVSDGYRLGHFCRALDRAFGGSSLCWCRHCRLRRLPARGRPAPVSPWRACLWGLPS